MRDRVSVAPPLFWVSYPRIPVGTQVVQVLVPVPARVNQSQVGTRANITRVIPYFTSTAAMGSCSLSSFYCQFDINDNKLIPNCIETVFQASRSFQALEQYRSFFLMDSIVQKFQLNITELEATLARLEQEADKKDAELHTVKEDIEHA
ncbi:hypothetical protein CY34DRAFT_470939 [Suillus luteus UH-Slu-Lm8-n1]|uniref:Uncharacterized protein n=1 Tax=Suillus luteus UH-Slu-Lm8-n1 TaxID=930992 RepID=A0A0D0ASG5_9AGAM|nr:hypothetical protein CY34DRAFT_470939 [Suillus luteus UH-Slu-Lm8-n1]